MNDNIKSRIFIISEYVLANQNSTGYYWSKIINGLSLNFHDISVICPEPDIEGLERCINLNVKYIYVKKVAHNKNNLLSRLYGQILQSVLFVNAVFHNVKCDDVIFSGTNPAPSLILISLLKKIKRFKWLLLVHDVFPENLIAAQIVKNNNPMYGAAKFIFDKVYSTPNILIAIGRDMKRALNAKTKMRGDIEYIPNWADADEIASEKNIASLISVSTKIRFQFFGNLGRLQDIDNLLKALKLIKTTKASFEFIGHGSEIKLILEFIENNPSIAISHSPGLPFGSSNSLLSRCDVAIVSLAIGMNGLGVPSKAYFSLAADKPLLVITDQGSELHQLIEEENSVGWYCEAGKPHELANLIDEICNSDFSHIQGKPRATMINKYEHKRAIDQYSQLISRLIT